MKFENMEITYLEYILQIHVSPNVDLKGHGNLCIKNPPSNTYMYMYLISTGKASIPHSPDVKIASAGLLLCTFLAFQNGMMTRQFKL